MARAFYYATNTRMAKDIMQYILHPSIRFGSYMGLRFLGGVKHEQALNSADIIASVAGGSIYLLNTETFKAIESRFLDKNAKMAVAAELGIDPDTMKFSDYLDSNNVIVRRELEDAKKVNRIRRATDALFFIPAAIYAASAITPGDGLKKAYQMGRLNRSAPKAEDNWQSSAIGAFNLWDTAIYGSKAAYWMYETYFIDKTAHYEIVKLDETIESTGKKFAANDLIAVVNRAREDRDLTQIQEKDERNTLWRVLEHLADKMNGDKTEFKGRPILKSAEEDKPFGMPELMYLVGLNKINIFELDQQGHEVLDNKGERIISEAEVQKSIAEIDRVAEIGLKGIQEENAHKQAEAASKGFAKVQTQAGSSLPKERFAIASQAERNQLDRSFARSKGIQDFVTGIFGRPRQTTDYISPRDGANVPQHNLP